MSSSSSKKKRRTQKNYTLLTQEEQCLRNPDMYVGSVNVQKNNDFEGHDWPYYFDGVLNKKYPIPALYKLVDELLVNVMDVYTKNKVSAEEEPVKNVSITTDYQTGKISVKNDGTGVPVEIHELASKALKKQILCPELVWFHFGSGDNFEGDRIVGGKNGYGAKLCGVFSSEYEVKTCDGKGKVFKMIAKDNMSKKSKASVKSTKASAYTKITFTIDLKRFSENGQAITNVPVDTQFAIDERIQDLANFMPDVKVKLNNVRVKPKTLAKQAKEVLGKVLFQHETDNYFVAVGPRKEDGGSGCCSYVNGTFNRNGGRHINQLLSALNSGMQQVSKSYKSANLNRFQLSRRLLVFASLKNVVNVMYDGQCKDEVKSANNLRCPIRYDIKEHAKYFKALSKSLKDYIERKKSASENREARATDGQGSHRYVNVEDLTDARQAGGVWSRSCSLYITEGKSAARLALEMLPKDKNGVLPIRGKMKNAGKHSKADFNKNKEVVAIKQALGLKQNTKSIENLRYGKLVIMTDQDSDGYHIRMLLLSMFAQYWPELITKGFIWIFETPIVRARRGAQTLNFYDQCKVEEHVKNNHGWSYKYYKGLGTSTAAEAREYYSQKNDLMWKVNGDVKLIKTCMGKGNDSHAYRRWVSCGETALPITNEKDRGSVEFIVKRQFGNFAFAQNLRKIPSMIDGLVPSMRKVLLYALQNFSDGDNDNIVDRFANRAADKMKYHHGSSNLIGVIVNMASDYVGGITLPYFYKGGQFASRHDNEHAAGRYLKTGLLPYVKLLYPPIDIQFFPKQMEDGEIIEPKFMVPIVPMIFVNGHKGGLGVGYLSEIPPRSLKSIIRLVRTLLTAPTGPALKLSPISYTGFKGKVGPGYTEGVYTKTNEEIVVTELPIGLKTDKFIEAIRKHTPRIEFMKDHGVGDNIHLKILGCEEEIVKKLMKRPIRRSWVTFFPNGSINDSTIDSRPVAPTTLIEHYMRARMTVYDLRKEKIAQDLKREHEKLMTKANVIQSYINGDWSAKDLVSQDSMFAVCNKITSMPGQTVPIEEKDLDVSIRKLNSKEYERLIVKASSCEQERSKVLHTPTKDIWLQELKELEEKIYGTQMDEDTVAVGQKRDIRSFFSE